LHHQSPSTRISTNLLTHEEPKLVGSELPQVDAFFGVGRDSERPIIIHHLHAIHDFVDLIVSLLP